MSDTFDIGDIVTVTANFRNLSDVLADPTTVTVAHLEPDGTQSVLTASKTSTGIYTATTAVLDQSGVHSVKFWGTGALVGAQEVSFPVRRTSFAS